MGDIFTSEEAQELLEDKHVVILGDSNFRSIYKDTVSLLQTTQFMATSHAKAKGELKFKGDTLVEGGRKGSMHNGISYREKRLFKRSNFKIEFEFITRVFNHHVESILKAMHDADRKPDVLIVNSALWDLTRYGANGVKEYKENVRRLLDRIESWIAPYGVLVIWAAAPPISGSPSGSLLVPEEDFLKDSLRMDIICANAFAAGLVRERGFDFVDLHFFLRQQIHRRVVDGIHWDNTALRRIVNLFLTHIAEAWGQRLPGRVDLVGEPLVAVKEASDSKAREEPEEDRDDELELQEQQEQRQEEQEQPKRQLSRSKSTAPVSDKDDIRADRFSKQSSTSPSYRPNESSRHASPQSSSRSNGPSRRPSPGSRLEQSSSSHQHRSSTSAALSPAPRSSTPSVARPPAPRLPRSSSVAWDFSNDDVGDAGSFGAHPPRSIRYGRHDMIQMNPYRGFSETNLAAAASLRHHPYAVRGMAGLAQFLPYGSRPRGLDRRWERHHPSSNR